MPKVYVVGSLGQSGGDYMAYNIGRILHLNFGYEYIDVQVFNNLGSRIFTYDIPMQTISVPQMESQITHYDILIANAFFSSFMFGLRLPGKKICYVQGFQTFKFLDCHFDLYVSASHLIKAFLQTVYRIETQVIHPFIQLEKMPEPIKWNDRPEKSLFVYTKNNDPEHRIARETIMREIKTLPGIKFTQAQGRDVTHGKFLQMIGACRYFLNISLAEGFGLIPLEAMAMGCTVTGLDGAAGRDYMRMGENAFSVPFKDLYRISEMLAYLCKHTALAEQVAQRGLETAQKFSYQHFYDAWVENLAHFI